MDPILSVMFPSPQAEGQVDASFAYTSLTLVVVGLCLMFTSATAILARRPNYHFSRNQTSIFSMLRNVFSKGTNSRVLLLSAVLYAIFFAFASGTIVYNPNVSFSLVYHASIPSSTVATCCASLGETPMVVVYLTEHLGLSLVPANLLLLFLVSWLVGLNVALTRFQFSLQRRKKLFGSFGGLGATLGLFSSCPTCAGLAVMSIVGGTSTLSASFFLGPLQLALVAVSIPVLVVSPILLVRFLRNNNCNECLVS